ncbi:MAG: YihY/virulence factor BrkB family protein [Candidatus Dormiibacterota bacterium]
MKQLFASVVSWVGRSYPGRLIAAFGSSQAGNYASGLAFNAFLSMFPLILGLLAIVGFVTQSAHARATVLGALYGFFPQDAHDALSSAFTTIHDYSGWFGAVSVIGLLWSGSSLFTSMEFALGMVIGARQRPFLRQRGMALVLTFLFVMSLVVTVGVNALIALPGPGWAFEPVVGLLVWYAFMLAVYRLVPNRTYRVRQLWPGVLIAGTAMEALTLLWPVYSGFTHGFSAYGTALTFFFILAAWLYFFAEFILLGAVANHMHVGGPDARGLLGSRDSRAPVAKRSQPDGGVS